MTTHYELLGVTPDAPSEAISAAYRALSKRLHPDRPGGDAEAFALVNAANDVLRNAESRSAYDASLDQAAAPETEPEFEGAPWGEEVELEEVIDAPVVPASTPTAYEPTPFEYDQPFLVWAVRTGVGRTWLIAMIASVALAVLASQIMRDRAAPLTKLPEIAPGDIFVMLILGVAIVSVLLGRRAAGALSFLAVATFWFWNQGSWAWAPDGRWTATASLLTASLVAALVATTALLQRD